MPSDVVEIRRAIETYLGPWSSEGRRPEELDQTKNMPVVPPDMCFRLPS
jgi:hypothetical protein